MKNDHEERVSEGKQCSISTEKKYIHLFHV